MRFKIWINEFFVPGSHWNRPKDITNVGMGVGSKYISPEEAGVSSEKLPNVADFGLDKDERKRLRDTDRLNRLRKLLKTQRNNDVKS